MTDVGATWELVARVAGTTAAMYVVLLVGVRVAGRRTLSHVSAFDAIVTIALGSIVATTSVSTDTGLAQGVIAVAVLLVLQVAVAFVRRVAPPTRRFLDFPPLLLMSREREVPKTGLLGPQITHDELLSALRTKGVHDLSTVVDVRIEPNGEISVRRAEDADSGPVTHQ